MELYDIGDYYKTREVIGEVLEDIIVIEQLELELTDCDVEEELTKYWRKHIVQIDYIL